MTSIQCFSLSDDVILALKQVPYGEKSAIVDEALKAYFELNPELVKTRERKTRAERYPATEITVDEL